MAETDNRDREWANRVGRKGVGGGWQQGARVGRQGSAAAAVCRVTQW